MKSFKDFFGGMFGEPTRKGEPDQANGRAPELAYSSQDQRPVGAPFKKGDFIGQKYEVYATVGEGGCGVVYLVYDHETKDVYALKTFRDEYIDDAVTRERFRREAQVWVDLERHPNLLRAWFVEEVAGRLYIIMDYIAPDESGLNTLEGYLASRPPDLAQSLLWAIQFCYGMEYAYSKGLRCHRDIKPANIMIGEGMALKIADFGLAGALEAASRPDGIDLGLREGRVGLSGQTMEGAGFGTPMYMPPEQFANAAGCDERSDIYAFGVVLYQMAAGGRLPFLAALPRDGSRQQQLRFWQAMYELHRKSRVPRLDSPLRGIVERCLEKEPGRRYQRFGELRQDLEPLLMDETGEVLGQPEPGSLRAGEWSDKGTSLSSLGRHDEALRCYDRALEIDPRYAMVWSNKGYTLHNLGRYVEAVACCDMALEIYPRYGYAWNNKGITLNSLGRYDEAMRCYDMALEIDPKHAYAWSNKGNSLSDLGRNDEAVRCYDRALELDPRYALAWSNKGDSLHSLGRNDEALRCCDSALAIDPRHTNAWSNKGISLSDLGRHDEALRCCDRAVEIDPRDARAWYGKGYSLYGLGRYDEAVRCFDGALAIDQRHARAWYNKAAAEDALGLGQDAAGPYRQFLDLATPADAALVELARRRLRELEGH